MLESLITSKTRLQLLLQFFLNPGCTSYLRRLASELGESTNAVRVELNRLEEAKLLNSELKGKQKWYSANQNHPLFPELNSIAKKVLGLDRIEEILANLGDVELGLVVGDYARGVDSGIIDVIIVGEVDRNYLDSLVQKAEGFLKRRIRTLIMNKDEFEGHSSRLFAEGSLVVWSKKQNSKKDI